MDESQQKTVAIKPCAACGSGLLEFDRFCRVCGARQPDPGDALGEVAYRTSRLAAGAHGQVYHRVSAPLVQAVLTGALAGQSMDNENAVIKRVMLTLISIPVWLIIVLLSPLDAYAAVRNLARQV